MLLRQRLKSAVGLTVILDEHEVPEFDDPIITDVDERAARTVGGEIDMNFRAGAARASLAHLPEVVLVAELQDVRRIDVGLAFPEFEALVVVLIDRGVQTLFGKLPDLGHQFPRPADRFLFIIVAERPVAEHLEKGVVIGIAPDIFEVVVLAGCADALLRVRRANVLPRALAEEHILELVHARVGEKKGRIFGGNDRRGTHDAVLLAGKKIEERLPYLS